MEEQLSKTINIMRNKKIEYIDEASITSLILGVLHSLDWDVFNPYEVEPQALVYSGKVDLALLIFGYRCVFIEIKKSSESLHNHEDQIIRYLSDAPDVEIGVLTNATSWWFYKRLDNGMIDRINYFDMIKTSDSQMKRILELYLSKSIFKDKILSKKANKLSMLEVERLKHHLSEERIVQIVRTNVNIFNSTNDVSEKLRALGCLRGFKDIKLIEIFQDIFSNIENDEDIRISALNGLWEINDVQTLKPLLYDYLDDNNPRIRDMVIEFNSLIEFKKF